MIASKVNNLRRYASQQEQAKARNESQVQAARAGQKPRTAAPAAPAAAAPAGGAVANAGPMPWDTQYETVVSGVKTGLDNSLAGLVNDENALAADYGIQFDRNGEQLTNFRLDPTNAFSKAALLQRAYQQRQTGNTNSYASRGQLYAGSLQNAQNDATFDNQQAGDALLKSFDSGVRDIVARRQAARDAANNATGQAGWDRLNAANSAPPAPAPNALARLTQATGGDMKSVMLTAKGLRRWNPATKKYDIPVGDI